MQTLKLLFMLFYRPAFAMSEIVDRGSWFRSAFLVLLVSAAFFFTVAPRLQSAYAPPDIDDFYRFDNNLPVAEDTARYRAALVEYQKAVAAKLEIPLVGDGFFRFFNFETGGFLKYFVALSVFYAPCVILLAGLFGGTGRFGELLPREYGALATCALTAWAAAHLPFALAAFALGALTAAGPPVYLALWAGSGVLFGFFMIFAVRVVFGANRPAAVAAAVGGAFGTALAMNVFQLAAPWMFAPFVLFYVSTHFSGRLGSEIGGWATAFGEAQRARRALDAAARNPFDAAPQVQLGLLYRRRRADARSRAHFARAFAIDPQDVEANYELGRLARGDGRWQPALDHFAVVVEQNDRHALSEIWREIGATYLAAGMLGEARAALEKFVARRPCDAEGLYYLGRVLKAQREGEKARDVFAQAAESFKSSPIYRRREVRYWSKLAEKEI